MCEFHCKLTSFQKKIARNIQFLDLFKLNNKGNKIVCKHKNFEQKNLESEQFLDTS